MAGNASAAEPPVFVPSRRLVHSPPASDLHADIYTELIYTPLRHPNRPMHILSGLLQAQPARLRMTRLSHKSRQDRMRVLLPLVQIRLWAEVPSWTRP